MLVDSDDQLVVLKPRSCVDRCADVVLQQDMDDLDDDLFKPKKKSTPSHGATSTATPSSKPDYTPSKMEYPSTKSNGELNISRMTKASKQMPQSYLHDNCIQRELA